MKNFAALTGLSVLIVCSLTAQAGVTADEVAKLGTTLTPFGAEKAGNTAGDIPAWTGGDQTVTAKTSGDSLRATNMFANEKPLFSITSQSVGKYEDKLSDGQIALFKKYPDYRIDVYPTHRTASAPAWVYENTKKNALNATAAGNGYAIKGAYGGIPFPIPKTGTEAMWNHLLMWQGEAWRIRFNAYVTGANGQRYLASDNQVDTQAPYYFEGGPKADYKEEYNMLRLVTSGPAQHAGEAVVTRDPLDQVGIGRQAWMYLTGQRRVRKLPNASYDTPTIFTSGLSNYDEIYTFSGPMDRYDWKLVGKKEMFIPYNNNSFFAPAKDADVLGAHFTNPDHVRWELHRVWVVEAKLAPGKRHVLPQRRFYLDEDTWMAQLADGWDASGKLWKSFIMLNINSPELPGVVPGPFVTYNLQTGDWVANNMTNDKKSTISFLKPWPDTHFTGDSLATEGVR
jgi:hypothetical protein